MVDQVPSDPAAIAAPAVRRLAVRPRVRHGLLALLVLGLALGAAGAVSAAPESAPPLDLNRATAQQLEGLPGIGAVKAEAIVAERASRGGFGTVEDLEEVRGIGPALVEKLRPHVRVGEKRAKGAKAAR